MNNSLSAKNQDLVNKTRSYLRSLARKRSSSEITADDANKFLFNNGVDAKRLRTRLAVINAALNSGDFRMTGLETASSRPEAKGRYIRIWTLA